MTLGEIELRVRILDQILQEARAAGDERWHEPARQIDELNRQRAELLRGQAPAVIIQAQVGTMGARTHG